MVVVFDLRERSEIGGFVPELGRADEYSIDADRKVITLGWDGQVSLEFGFNGEPVDRGALTEQRLRNSNGYQLRDYVAERLEAGPLSGDSISECLELLHEALRRGVSTWTQGQVWSMIGDLHERAGGLAEAVSAYEAALTFAPRLPLRKKLEELRGSLR